MKVESLSEQLFFVTSRIEARSATDGWVGTGFVVAVDTEHGPAHFLVTNKHVLADAQTLTVRFVRAAPDGTTPELGRATQLTITGFNDDSWLGHPDESVDVAIMAMGPLLEDMHRRGAAPFFRSVGPDLVLSPEQAEDLDAIESVTFIGYPSGIYDSRNFLPIARRGTTATPIPVDYQGVPAFLIDASVFPGSSGSPVFIVDQGAYSPRGGGIVVGGRVHFVGVLAAVHTRQVEGDVQSLPTSLVASFEEPIDLGIVFKGQTVLECVRQILAKAGLTMSTHQDEVLKDTSRTEADQTVEESGSSTPISEDTD